MGKVKAKAVKKTAPDRISAEDFVEIWQSANSVEQAAEKCKMPILRVCSRAHVYRKKGIPLQKFAGGRRGPRLDVDKLKKLASSLASKK